MRCSHGADEKREHQHQRVKVEVEHGKEPQAPHRADQRCKNRHHHAALGAEKQKEHHQHGDDGVDKNLQCLRHIAFNVADVHGIAGYGYKVIIIFIFLPQRLQLLEGNPVIHLLFKKIYLD